MFLLSPAHCGGERAQLVLRDQARFDLASRLRAREGASLGEVFSFLSGLYFRGKLAYAQSFARPAAGVSGVMVITPCEGLREVALTVSGGPAPKAEAKKAEAKKAEKKKAEKKKAEKKKADPKSAPKKEEPKPG